MSITSVFVSTSPAQNGAMSGPVRVMTAVVNWMRRRYAIHMHRRTLHELPDHVLEDIGIRRSMINRIVPERLDRAGRPQGPYPF